MIYRKEKQWIVGNEGANVIRLNLDTGVVYSGEKEYQAAAPRFCNIRENETISSALAQFISQYATLPFEYLSADTLATICSYGERYAALGKVLDVSKKTIAYITSLAELVKEVPISAVKANIITIDVLDFQKRAILYNKMKKIFAHAIEVAPRIKALINTVVFSHYIDISDEACISMTRMLIAEKLYVFPSFMITELLICWYDCKKRAEEPYDKRPKHGLLLEMAETNARVTTYKNTHITDSLRAHNDLPYLYFEDDTYICRPLITAEDFYDEAKQQSNCVARQYLDPTARGETHIVSIRYKRDPEHSLITCEIDNNGNIRQYLHAYNRGDITQAEKNFGIKLIEHIQEARKGS